MELSNNALIEKWGFRLALYTFVSVFLVLFTFISLPAAFDQEVVLLRSIILAIILFPCLVGGIVYMFLGIKFRSPIFLSVSLSALLMIIVVGDAFYIPTQIFRFNGLKIYGYITVAFCCVLILRRNGINCEKNKSIEKWGIRLANFTMCVPLFVSLFIVFPRMLPISFATRNVLIYLLVMLMIPSIVGGIFYLGSGAKLRSSKIASVGLASLVLSLQNSFMLFRVLQFLFNPLMNR